MFQAIAALCAIVATGPLWERDADPAATGKVEDVFGRTLNGRGLVLVDWEGYMANPAMRVFFLPPRDAHYPVRATVTASSSRIYFDLPSTTGPDGPRKKFLFQGYARGPLAVAIFPDRDGHDEDHTLKVEFEDSESRKQSLELPLHVIDQDRDSASQFVVHVDFGQDRTGFFASEERKAVVRQAAADWAYFLDGTRLDSVPAETEKTYIWNSDGFKTRRLATNRSAYTGYLLYAYGIDSPAERSGGEPSIRGGFQTERGAVLPVRRSGGLEVEIKGNYNRKGWSVGLDDQAWWRATNLKEVEPDLYSIVHHEIGHALVFNPANIRFGMFKIRGSLRDERVGAYLGSDPKIDRADHLAGTIDPLSLRGAFGNEYLGKVPQGRWLITKLDLLCAGAVGYRLRATSAFEPLGWDPEKLPEARVSVPYSVQLRARGGIPFYDWTVVSGSLPEGLDLDRFTGRIHGQPRRSGEFSFVAKVRDYDEHEAGLTRKLVLRVAQD